MNDKLPLELSKEFNYALDVLENTSTHFFITGRAGTGKSTLLQLFTKTTRKKVAVLAPTGIAALNVKGQTLHSFFGFPPRLLHPKDLQKRRNYRMYLNLDMIVIDEISMVRADMLDNIDMFLRINRNRNEPFGGVQMVFFGDLFQLPPVIGSPVEKEFLVQRYESPYFFSSRVIKTSEEFEMIELNKVYRQDERRFIRLLDNIRLSHFDMDDLEDLNTRHVSIPENISHTITLSSRNAVVKEINQRELSKLTSEPFTYLAEVTGDFSTRQFPTDSALILRKGAQVMFVKNDPLKKFVNGTIGEIVEIDSDKIKVEIIDQQGMPKEITVEKLDWEILKYQLDEENKTQIKTKTIGTFRQFPLKLAWAITIHKSQGKTFQRIIIDMGRGAFEYGQTYVALSRCKTLDGIILKNPLRPRDIMVDQRITEFYSQHQ